MSIKINYLKKTSSISSTNLVLFYNEKYNINNLQRYLSDSEYTYIKDLLTEIFPEAIGLFLVLSTFLSKSLSTTSLKIHPALLIRTEPIKKSIK